MNIELTAVIRELARDPKGTIAQWEARYLSQVRDIAERVLENREKSPVVLLAGPSGSSKTTTGCRLKEQLEGLGASVHLISMDNYYRDWDEADFPRMPDGSRNLESPWCMNIPLLNDHFSRLETGTDIQVPVYDFPTHRPLENQFLHMSAAPGTIFIFEGIHALNPLFTTQHPHAFRLYVSPASAFYMGQKQVCGPEILRLMRRITRDHLFRGATAEFSLELWGNVVASEKIYVEPYKSAAHGTVDTTLGYELMALKPMILPLVQELPRTVPCRGQVDEAMEVLKLVEGIPGDWIPAESIIREFIG